MLFLCDLDAKIGRIVLIFFYPIQYRCEGRVLFWGHPFILILTTTSSIIILLVV